MAEPADPLRRGRGDARELPHAHARGRVFPGGGREVFKRKGEKYRLLWGDRLGFVRLAIEHRYPILPFGAVGAEECFEILVDAGDVLATPLGPLLERLVPRIAELPPLVRGLGPTPLPRPQRFYFAFGAAIETAAIDGRAGDDALCRAVREEVRRAVEARVAFLLRMRERDAGRGLLARALGLLGRAPEMLGFPASTKGSHDGHRLHVSS
jgi:hypothetical protein